jgi:phosphatidylinositol 4-kinase
MVCFLLQIKDHRNILLDKLGHLMHIDFGFFFLSSPGRNVGFESTPFKLTRDLVEVLDGTDSHLFRTFRDLCIKTFITLHRRCMEIILLFEMLKIGITMKSSSVSADDPTMPFSSSANGFDWI